jgi:cell filamentation protein
MRDESFVINNHQYTPVDISKGNDNFLATHLIQNGIDVALKPLENIDSLKQLSPEQFANITGKVLGELNYVHPFREGNGRTQRLFIEEIGREVGHEVNFDYISRERILQVSIETTRDPKSIEMIEVMRCC